MSPCTFLHLLSLTPPSKLLSPPPYLSFSLQLPLLVASLTSPVPLSTFILRPALPLSHTTCYPSTPISFLCMPVPSFSHFCLPYLLLSLRLPPIPSLSVPLCFLTLYVPLMNFLLCSICPFPTSPTPFQQTHLLNGCSPYMQACAHTHTRAAQSCQHAPRTLRALPQFNSRGSARYQRTG